MAEFDDVELGAKISIEMSKMTEEDKIAYLEAQGIEVVSEADLDQMVFANLLQDAQVA